MNYLSLLLLLCAFACHSSEGALRTLFCYWGSWSTYRSSVGELQPYQINPHSCTHLVYAFAGLSPNNEVKALDPWSDLGQFEPGGGKDNYRKLTALKRNNPQLKVLISIGGWNEGSSKFSQMASHPYNRKTFVNSVVSFIQRYSFDGLDFAWQWPGGRGGLHTDKQNYVLLLKELKDQFRQYNYVLSIAGPALPADVEAGFDLPQIMNHVDFLSIYAYDYAVSAVTLNHGSPLYSPPSGGDSVDNTIRYYLTKGATANKLLMGTTIYTRAMVLSSASKTNIGDYASGFANPGPYTQTRGLLGWFEACLKFTTENFVTRYESSRQVAYAFNSYEWISFENAVSQEQKIEYANNHKLGGLTVWSLENDDNHHVCGAPLVSGIRQMMDRQI